MKYFRAMLVVVGLFPAAVIADDILTIAVASNFRSTAQGIATAFTEATKIPVRISSGSTGGLYAQIVNGAPYDVFLAADIERPNLLVDRGLAITDTAAIYAIGHLVLWSNEPRFTSRDCLEDFERGDFTRLSIANPGTAPYGRAAIDYLEAQGLADDVAEKLILGENVAQAFQFVATGNTNFGLVALSQVSGRNAPAATCVEALDGADVSQAGLVLSTSRNEQAARQFMAFMQTVAMREFIHRSGYSTSALPPVESQ